jgi:hypothetical protein
MTANPPQGFNPYETRLELRCRGGLLALPSSLWSKSAALCGATIVSSRIEEGFRSYILSLSSLFVFDEAVILICCSQSSYDTLIAFWMEELATCQPYLISQEKRSEGTLGGEKVRVERSILWRSSTSSIDWRHRTVFFTQSFFTQPFFTQPCLTSASPSRPIRNLIHSIVQQVLTESSLLCIEQVHIFAPTSLSSNHLLLHEGNLIGYITLHYSDLLYLSVESGWIEDSENPLLRGAFVTISREIESSLVERKLRDEERLSV